MLDQLAERGRTFTRELKIRVEAGLEERRYFRTWRAQDGSIIQEGDLAASVVELTWPVYAMVEARRVKFLQSEWKPTGNISYPGRNHLVNG